MPKAIALPNEAPQKEGIHDISKLIRRAEKGDKLAMAELRPLLNEAPETWEIVGNLARHAESALVNVAAGENEMLKEALTIKLATLKEEWGADTT